MEGLARPINTLLHKSRSKKSRNIVPSDMCKVVTVILGGGEGKRLFPLTQYCCKPALNFAGRYRLIDFPISNSINSGSKKIYVLTQFLSTSLHRHIVNTYSHFGFDYNGIEILSPEQRPDTKSWFEGTADAVRQTLSYLLEYPADYFLILSGDQVYSMDYRRMLQVASTTNADLVLAARPIREKDCDRMGVLQVDQNLKITRFFEKPKDPALVKELEIPEQLKLQALGKQNKCNHLGSMGIYLFKKEALLSLLAGDKGDDFGMHLLPMMIEKGNSSAYIFDEYWEDIGTIESFYHANMELTNYRPAYHLYDEMKPIFSSHNELPSSKLAASSIDNSLICDGCMVDHSTVKNSILGPRTVIQKDCMITNSYVMGNDHYHRPILSDKGSNLLLIDKKTVINKCIISKNVHIGANVQLLNLSGHVNYDSKDLYVRQGIIVIPQGVTIPDGFTF